MAKYFWKARRQTMPQEEDNSRPAKAHQREHTRTRKLLCNGKFYVRRICLALNSVLKPCAPPESNIIVDCEAWTRHLSREVALKDRRFNFSSAGVVREQANGGATLESYFDSHNCANCYAQTSFLFCEKCTSHPQSLHSNVMFRVAEAERRCTFLSDKCSSCAGKCGSQVVHAAQLIGIGRSGHDGHGGVQCTSLDCPVYFARRRAATQLRQATLMRDALVSRSF